MSKEEKRSINIRDELIQYLRSIGQARPEINADQLLDINGGFVERLKFFSPHIPDFYKKHMLISGCAVGSELIASKNFSFKRITGTEVTNEYVEMAKKRIQTDPDLSVDYYDGLTLPYPDGNFGTVYSGHIIEHTNDPFQYFKEHMRVLQSGGYFFLEFPNRYNWKELHTGEFSLEYLPKQLRDWIIKNIVLKAPLLSKNRKHNYLAIMETLHPISNRMINDFYYRLFNKKIDLIKSQIPHKGFMRLLIKKP